MYRIGLFGATILTVACGNKEPPTPSEKPEEGKRTSRGPTKPAVGTPRPQPKLVVTVDGKPIEIISAYAVQKKGVVRFMASSALLGCDDATDLARHDGELTFAASIGRRLQPDGTLAPTILKAFVLSRTKGMVLSRATRKVIAGPVELRGDVVAGEPTLANVDFKIASPELAVKGTIDALGCPAPAEAAPAPSAPLPPTMPATIEIAGRKLPVRGAQLWHAGPDRHLSLTTGGEACNAPENRREGDLTIDLGWEKAGDSGVQHVGLHGALLEPTYDREFDKSRLTVTPGPVPGQIELHGDITVMKYPVKIDGKVTAVECE